MSLDARDAVPGSLSAADTLRADGSDLDLQVVLAVALAAEVGLSSLELDDLDLVGPVPAEHVGGYLGALDVWRADLGAAVLLGLADHKDIVKGDRGDVGGQVADGDAGIGLGSRECDFDGPVA